MTDMTTYPELLGAIDEFAGGLNRQEQAARLYGLIAPLLGRVEQEDEELSDEPALTTPEAVRGIRSAAAGEPADFDAVHQQLTEVGLCYSEDQDPQRHLISQTAYAAAAWLCLLAGRGLRIADCLEGYGHEDLIPPFAPSAFTRIVDLLAWTRAGQVYTHWEDALPEEDELNGELTDAIRELREMWREITGRS